MRLLPFDDHRDARGFVVNPFEHLLDTGAVFRCHAFSIAPGTVRGGHAHPERNEKAFLLAGRVVLRTPSGDTALEAPALVELEPGEYHSFHCPEGSDAVLLCWSDAESPGPSRCSG